MSDVVLLVVIGARQPLLLTRSRGRYVTVVCARVCGCWMLQGRLVIALVLPFSEFVETG
jgi:hypothetical protein